MLTKAELRAKLVRERENRFTIDVKSYSLSCQKVAENAIRLIKDTGAENIMLYLPLRGEADVTGVTYLPLKFYVPVTEGAVIRPAAYRPDTALTKGAFGVSVPAEPEYADKGIIDFVLVPAVAFDVEKNRLGFGKGCYDRFLAGMDCIKAAAGFDFQLVDSLETGPHDIKMDYIITESGYF